MVKLVDVWNELHIGNYTDKQQRVIDCHACGFRHLYPIPANTEQYYEADQFYTEYSPPDWFAKEKREYEAGLWDSYYSYLASLLPRGKRIIDYGCGAGWMVDYLRRIERRAAYGIEPSKMAREWSPLDDFLYPNMTQLAFVKDYTAGNVILSLVLEHIADPTRFLQEDILPILDGRLIVIVPNDFSPLQRLIGGDWFVSSVHVNYFTPRTLKALLEQVGLKVVYTSSTFPMEIFLLLGFNYRGNDNLGRWCHQYRLNLEKRFGSGIFRIYNILYRLFGIGREIIMVAEKP